VETVLARQNRPADRHRARAGGGGRDRKAVILVEIDEQHGARPDGGLAVSASITAAVGRALRRAGGAGVFRSAVPTTQLICGRRSASTSARSASSARVKAPSASTLRDPDRRDSRAILQEIGQRIVGEIVGHVLIDRQLTPRFQPFGIGRPEEARLAGGIGLGQIVVRDC
jgi:hypothetical protein